MRGHLFTHVFVDNADLFEDNPLELVASAAFGVTTTFTYTPFEGSSLPRSIPKSVSPPEREIEDNLMMIVMLAYLQEKELTDA